MGVQQDSIGAAYEWIQTSLIKISILKEYDHGAMIEHPISHEKSNSVGDVFIDDTNLYAFDRVCYTGKKLFRGSKNEYWFGIVCRDLQEDV